MRHFIPFLVFVLILAGCGAPDQANDPPATPIPTILSKVAPTSVAPTSVAPTSVAPTVTAQPTTLPTPRPFAELPLEEALFQPGDLPNGVTAGVLSHEVRDWVQGMSSAFPDPDAAAYLPLERAGRKYGTGTIDMLFYNTPDRLHAAYAELTKDVAFRAPGLPQLDIGEQAMLFPANADAQVAEIIFVRCRAVVSLRLFEHTTSEMIHAYAQRMDQRLTAIVCDGAADAPVLPTLPPTNDEQLLFQPGDLPDGVAPGPVGQAQLMTDKMPPDLAQPERAIARGFTQDGGSEGYGLVALYSYDTGTPVKPLYQWLISWEDTPGLPQPDVGDQATLFLPDSGSKIMSLFFMVCHTAVKIHVRASAEQPALLHYARRLAQRITAVDCAGAAAVPLLSPAPLAPPPTPAPTAMITRDGVATIERLPDPAVEDIVRAYSFADADHGWLARGATILATSDGGQNWREQFRIDSEVQAITFVSATRGWIETARGIVLTEDGGATWQPTSVLPDAGTRRMPRPQRADMCGDFYPRHFASIDEQTGWMLCLSEPSAGWQGKKLFQTVDGGTSWQVLVKSNWEHPTTLPDMSYASDLFFLDRQHGWIGQARGGLLATVDGGQTWQQVTTPGEAATWVDQVQFLSVAVGFARAPQEQGPPTLFRTVDGGATWKAIYDVPPPSRRPDGPVQFFADGSGIGAVENWDGAFFRTDNAGRTWTQIGEISGMCGQFSTGVTDLSFADPQHGWATIACATRPQRALYRTDDGGVTWSRLAAPGPDDDASVGISFVDSRTGYLISAAGYLWRTDDGGAIWTAVDRQATHTRNLAFATVENGWELRGPQLFATTDGGQSWHRIALELPIQQFALLPDGHAWALAGETASASLPQPARLLLATSDGGQNWRALRMDDLPSDWWPPRQDSLQFVDSQHGWVYSGGALFYTEDGGQHWTQLH